MGKLGRPRIQREIQKSSLSRTPRGTCPRCQGTGVIEVSVQKAYMDSPPAFGDAICPDCEGDGVTDDRD